LFVYWEEKIWDHDHAQRTLQRLVDCKGKYVSCKEAVFIIW